MILIHTAVCVLSVGRLLDDNNDYTLQEHQPILTNETLSKASDIERRLWSITKSEFYEFERNKEMCVQTNIEQKY